MCPFQKACVTRQTTPYIYAAEEFNRGELAGKARTPNLAGGFYRCLGAKSQVASNATPEPGVRQGICLGYKPRRDCGWRSRRARAAGQVIQANYIPGTFILTQRRGRRRINPPWFAPIVYAREICCLPKGGTISRRSAMPRHTSTDSSLKSLNKSRNATPLTSANGRRSSRDMRF